MIEEGHKALMENIWKKAFDSGYLRILEENVNRFVCHETVTTHRLGYNTEACQGLRDGSRVLVAASFIAQRGGSTDSGTSLFCDETGYQSLIQRQLIESWALHTGLWLDDTTETLTSLYGREVSRGSESHVFYDESNDTIVKEWDTGRYESLQLALDRIAILNAIFPEAIMSVEGFGRRKSGEFVAILRQPYIDIDLDYVITLEEKVDLFDTLGFSPIQDEKGSITEFYNRDFFLADLHDRNVIKVRRGDGSAFFTVIDCDAYLNTPGIGKRGGFIIGNPEPWSSGNEDDWPFPIERNDPPGV